MLCWLLVYLFEDPKLIMLLLLLVKLDLGAISGSKPYLILYPSGPFLLLKSDYWSSVEFYTVWF